MGQKIKSKHESPHIRLRKHLAPSELRRDFSQNSVAGKVHHGDDALMSMVALVEEVIMRLGVYLSPLLGLIVIHSTVVYVTR